MSDIRQPEPAELALMRNVARSFAKSYPQIDCDDIAQDMLVRWYDKWDVVSGYLSLPEGERDAILIRTFQSWGIDYCRTELREFRRLHPQPEDQYYYSREQVRRMVPFVEDPAAWSAVARHEDDGSRRTKGDAATGGNALAHYADLRIAWEQLHPAERNVLRLRYVQDAEYFNIAALEGISESYARKRVERGLSKLQRLMGCDTRSRRVLSNATAQVLTRQEYEGE